MLQEPVTFDLRNMIDGPSAKMEIYSFFFLVAFLVTAVKVFRIWWVAPPFKLSRQSNHPTFLLTLENSIRSLKYWSVSMFLGWGLLISLRITDLCNNLPYQRASAWLVIVSVAREVSVALTMAMLVMLFSILARWHILKRIEYLKRPTV